MGKQNSINQTTVQNHKFFIDFSDPNKGAKIPAVWPKCDAKKMQTLRFSVENIEVFNNNQNKVREFWAKDY